MGNVVIYYLVVYPLKHFLDRMI